MGGDVFSTVTDAARSLHLQDDEAAVLGDIVRQAHRCLPEFDHVSLSLVRDRDRLETLSATGTLALAFDQLQSDSGDGPCADAIAEDEVVAVRHAHREGRWPGYLPQAVELGLRSQLGVRVPNDGAHAEMGLNLYSTSHDEIDPGSIGVAEHFAFHAGLALGQVRREAQLRTAIGTRTTIGTAIGILMERHTLSQESAFAYLVRLSSTENRKVRVLASEIVEQAERGTMARNGVDVRGTHGSVHEPRGWQNATCACGS